MKRFDLVLQDLTRAETIEQRLSRYKGAGPGFDILRLVLALLIFYGHTRGIAGVKGESFVLIQSVPSGGGGVIVPFLLQVKHRLFSIYVPMFFALSGFLVTGSALRLLQAGPFLAFRALRIFPALTIEVALSALILGPLVTNTSLQEYFSSPDFFKYFLNILGLVHFFLPGVFADSAFPAVVNANLWTLPAEFYCYLITIVIMTTSLFSRPRIFGGLLIMATVLVVATSIFINPINLDRVASIELVVYYFFLGMAFYYWRNSIPLHVLLFMICVVVTILMFNYSNMAFLMPIPLTYATVYFGCLGFRGVSVLRRHDISYGIYLYGFPITQATAHFIPGLAGHNIRLFVVSLIITAVFATLSWHYIEKPALKLKKLITARSFKLPALVR